MPVLPNAKHERFAQELAKGATADQAYQDAGYKPDRSHAARLAANGPVLARVGEIQARGAIRAEVTVQSIAQELTEVAAEARAAAAYGPAVSAIMGKAKVCGLIVDKTLDLKRRIEDMTSAELAAELAAIEGNADQGGAQTTH